MPFLDNLDMLAFQLKLIGKKSKKNVLISAGKLDDKRRMLPSIKKLASLNIAIYATPGTSRFLDAEGVANQQIHKIADGTEPNILSFLEQERFDLIINVLTGDHDYDEYGWLVPAAGPVGSVRPVLGFVEKPHPEKSEELQRTGALVNSFILASRARTLVRLYEEALPELVRALVPVVLDGRPEAALRELYDAMLGHDFSRAVLERFPEALGVLAVPPCGWSDLGTPARLRRFLAASASRPAAAIGGPTLPARAAAPAMGG